MATDTSNFIVAVSPAAVAFIIKDKHGLVRDQGYNDLDWETTENANANLCFLN